MKVRPGLEGSYEELFHHVGLPRFWIDLHAGGPSIDSLRDDRLERAIGVVYRPSTEHWGNWVPTVMGRRYDAFLSFDETTALVPLRPERPVDDVELETFPWTT